MIKRLIASIASGQYPDGTPLPAERRLSADIGVSRGTVRAALEELRRLGLIDIKPGSGAYVRHRSFSDVPQELLPTEVAKVTAEDMMAARKAIEIAAIENTAENLTAEQLSQIQDLVSEMAYKANDLAEFLRLDVRFHRCLIEYCGNPVLVAAYDAIEEYNWYLQVVSTQNAQCEQLTLASHLKIVASLANRDKSGAKKALSEHLDNVLEQMR